MAEAILDLRLDTVQPNRVRLVYGVQNDYNSRYICARFTANGKPIDIEKTAAVRINAKRPDGKKDAFPGTVNADGTAKVPVAQWMLEVPGEVSASITAVTTGGALTTQEFYIMAKASIWDSTGEPSAENPDKDVLQTIIASENERVAAESTRVANENARKSAETARATAETKRIADEATRVVNEAGRVSAEEIRREEFATWQDEWGKISSFDKRIENLEAAVSPEIVTPVTDSTVAYAKTVPKGALPNAAITEIGGMSYVKNGAILDSKVTAVESVGTNLISFPYNSNEEKINGVNWTVNPDGTVVANGTADGGNSAFYLTDELMLSAGGYVISGVPASAGYNATVTMYCVDDEGQQIPIKTSSGEYSYVNAFGDGALAITIPRRAKATIYTQVIKGSTCSNLVFKPMLNRGSAALPYTLYFRETLPIPGDALDGWGQGVNAQLYNKIVLDPIGGVKKYVRKSYKSIGINGADGGRQDSGFANTYYIGVNVAFSGKNNLKAILSDRYSINTVAEIGKKDGVCVSAEEHIYITDSRFADETTTKAILAENPLYFLGGFDEAEETDVSHLFTDDNLLPVVPGGTITAVNEYEQAVPFTIEYTVKGA